MPLKVYGNPVTYGGTALKATQGGARTGLYRIGFSVGNLYFWNCWSAASTELFCIGTSNYMSRDNDSYYRNGNGGVIR